MKERKVVKFRVDMLGDTKFKIIDTKPERDLIHFVWMALVLLAGKVNLYGELYLSKNIPYTIETLAIEFNREVKQVKLALELLMELEMVELTEAKVYKVKNFTKHQNIKVKDKEEVKEAIKVEEIKDTLNEEAKINEIKTLDNDLSTVKTEQESRKIIELNSPLSAANINEEKIEDKHKDNIIDKSKENITTTLEIFKGEKVNKGKKKSKAKKSKRDNIFDISDEEIEEEPLVTICEGERPLDEGERVLEEWTF